MQKVWSLFLNIRAEDTHNFFAVAFRTTCADATGSTHALEHMSLQGSRHFPFRSVFSEMMKRSTAVLMNAFTSVLTHSRQRMKRIPITCWMFICMRHSFHCWKKQRLSLNVIILRSCLQWNERCHFESYFKIFKFSPGESISGISVWITAWICPGDVQNSRDGNSKLWIVAWIVWV